MSPSLWLGWRTFLAVGLVALSGWTRYVAPAQPSTSDERTKLERELELEPLRAEVRRRKAVGWRGVAGSITGANNEQNITQPIAQQATSNTSPVLTQTPPTPDPDPTPPSERTQDPSDRTSTDEEPPEDMRTNVRSLPPFTVVPARKSVRADTGCSRRVSEETRQKRLEIAREILSANRTIGVRELGRRIALATKHRISLSTVSTIRASVLADLERERRMASAARS